LNIGSLLEVRRFERRYRVGAAAGTLLAVNVAALSAPIRKRP
jgi:hypothetical protein